MKKLVLAIAVFPLFSFSAYAADLPNTKGPPTFAPPPPPQFTWTGLYIGGQVGYQWGTTDYDIHTEVPPALFFLSLPEPGYNNQGVVGGGHMGYNFQVNQFVLGIEGDVEGTSYNGSGAETAFSGGTGTNATRINIEGSIRGRLGWAWDRVLIYGTGGGAFAEFRNSFSIPLGGFYNSASFGRVGWTAGGGIEYAIDPNWSVRAEYRYTDYGSYDFALTGTGPLGFREHERDNRVEGGFSYKFDMFAPPMPVVAKY